MTLDEKAKGNWWLQGTRDEIFHTEPRFGDVAGLRIFAFDRLSVYSEGDLTYGDDTVEAYDSNRTELLDIFIRTPPEAFDDAMLQALEDRGFKAATARSKVRNRLGTLFYNEIAEEYNALQVGGLMKFPARQTVQNFMHVLLGRGLNPEIDYNVESGRKGLLAPETLFTVIEITKRTPKPKRIISRR